MLVKRYYNGDTAFEKEDGTFYQFDDAEKARLGCGSCKIYSDRSKETLLHDGYCLNDVFICSYNESTLPRYQHKMEEMFRRLGL